MASGPFTQGFVPALQARMEEDRQRRFAMAQQAIQSGQYQAQTGGQRPSMMQNILGSITGPSVGGSSMSMDGQSYQQVTPQMKQQQLQQQIAQYGNMLGQPSGADNTQMEREIRVDPSTGKTEITFKQKPKDTSISASEIGALPPEQARETMKKTNPAYAKYLEKLADGSLSLQGRSSKFQQKVQQDLAALYPDMDIQKINARAATRKDFSTGKAALNIKSLNTAAGHLKSLYDTVDKLGNTPFKPWNQVKNWSERKVQTGAESQALARFNTIKNALAGELATIFKNTGGTDTEISNIAKTIDDSDSPENLKESLKASLELMGSRMGSLQDQWKNAFDMPEDKPFPVISPRAKAALASIGATGEHIGEASSPIQETTGQSNDYQKYLQAIGAQ